jgi:GTP cyclohydrolase-4
MPLPDIQSLPPEVQMSLSRVGITGVKKLVEVARKKKRPIILISNFDLFVDLPASIKGANLSRNLEVMNEVLEEAVSSPIYEIEELCTEVARRLLHKHKYATRAEVKMEAELIVKKKTPITRIGCQETVNIFASTLLLRNGQPQKMVGAEVLGMTACPCSQEIVKEIVVKELRSMKMGEDAIQNFLSKVPVATHNQRGHGTIAIQTSGSPVRIEKIVDIIESSMSSEIFELLKREDEAVIISKAHSSPKFVEDCVRTMAKKIVEEFKELSDDAIVTIRQLNEESIHRHNAFAEHRSTMGELRKELQ